jgi:predicted dehydrogenase
MTRVAVVGAGVMGTNHARVLSNIPGVELVGVVDPDSERASAVARSLHTDILELEQLAGRVDAAVVATPSQTHTELGCILLDAGVDLLVEKPIATSVEEGRRLIDVAAANERVLMIGHIERFNAAVLGLDKLIDDPVHIEFTRASPFSARITSDVVLDLMIHDLDLARKLSRAKTFTSMHAVGSAVHSEQIDLASCLLTADNGVTVTLTASRAGQNKIRLIEITQRKNFVTADLLRQDINVHRVAHSEFTSDGGTRYSQSGVVEIPFLDHTGEPLRVELEAFISAVNDRSRPPVNGEDGLAALELALRVAALAGRH